MCFSMSVTVGFPFGYSIFQAHPCEGSSQTTVIAIARGTLLEGSPQKYRNQYRKPMTLQVQPFGNSTWGCCDIGTAVARNHQGLYQRYSYNIIIILYDTISMSNHN